jgi:hypothetical protein
MHNVVILKQVFKTSLNSGEIILILNFIDLKINDAFNMHHRTVVGLQRLYSAHHTNFSA